MIVGALILIAVFAIKKEGTSTGCEPESNWDDCDWVRSMYDGYTGETAYVHGWQTSTCSGSSYAICIDSPSNSVPCTKGSVINTCSATGGDDCSDPPGEDDSFTCYDDWVQYCNGGTWVPQEICSDYPGFTTPCDNKGVLHDRIYQAVSDCTESAQDCNYPDAPHNKFTCKDGWVELCDDGTWSGYSACEDYSGKTDSCESEDNIYTSPFDAKDDCEDEICVPDWDCDTWSTCSVSCKQTRTCTDANSCGTNTGKPETSQTCTGGACGGCTNNYYICDVGLVNHCESGNWVPYGECGVGDFEDQPYCKDEGKPTGLKTQVCSADDPCVEDWSCDVAWSTCSVSCTQTRTCIDANSCGTTVDKPTTSQACTGGDCVAPPPTCSSDSECTGACQECGDRGKCVSSCLPFIQSCDKDTNECSLSIMVIVFGIFMVAVVVLKSTGKK